MITFHGASNQVALICRENAMHYKILPIDAEYEGMPVYDWFVEFRDELCTPCFEKLASQASKRSKRRR